MSDFVEQHAVTLDHRLFPTVVNKLEKLVDAGVPERKLQAHLEAYPYLLSQQFSHCHHVFPKVRLGSQYEPDFLCLDIPSSGDEWFGVELEPSRIKIVTKSGRKSAKLEHALQQVRDWRAWIGENLSYARNERTKNGLGLRNIQSRFAGYVIIGRRADYTDSFNSLRAQVLRDEYIQIRSWDGIIEWARKRAILFSSHYESLVQVSNGR
jgi:hypothetical protein